MSDDDEIEADEDGSLMAGNLNLHPHHGNAPSNLQTGDSGGGGYRVSGSKTTTSHHPSSGGFPGMKFSSHLQKRHVLQIRI